MKLHHIIICFVCVAVATQPSFASKKTETDSTSVVKVSKRHINRFNDNGKKRVFIPKGNVMMGGMVGGTSIQGDNLNILILKNIRDISGYYFSASPYIGGFVADNVAIGGRFNYHRLMANLGNLDLNLGADMNISLKDLYTITHKYEGSFFVRNYIPFGKSKVVGMFVDTNITYTRSQGKNTTGSGAELDGTFQQGQSIGLYVNPGLCVFVADCVAAELGVGILGIEYAGKKSITNQVETGEFTSKGANLKFNLLKIDLGISFYF